LVDGLHEDLNRIKKKPYTENPESDDRTVHDPEAIKALGEKFREIHRSRNDSVAMDLFNGFYKNTMVCPDCEKVSITFDPYSLLTLQLPIGQTWQHTITFVPLNGEIVNIEVDIDKNATIKNLKEYIAKRFPAVKWNRLMGAEIYTHKFYRVLEDNKLISECNIAQRDVIFFYELAAVPTNWPPRKKKQQRSMLYPMASSEEDIPTSASPLGDRLLVPIFHRSPNMSSYRGQSRSLTLWPSYIVLTREEAKDYDTILKKVLGKVAQMTTRAILDESAGTSNDQSRTGSDIVLTTDEDASPNGDPSVQDGSVEGEDNLVEVTMTEPNGGSDAEGPDESIPHVLRPGSFIPPECRLLFDLKHTRPGKEMVPTGWSSIDANKPYELIADRVRVQASPQSSTQPLDDDATSNASSSEEADDAIQFSADAQSSFQRANESSEDEVPSIETDTFARGGRQNSRKNKRKNKKVKTRGGHKNGFKKGKDRFDNQHGQSYFDLESDDDEGLIRLGEGIVLEWSAEGYDALFDGNPLDPQDLRGVDTTKQVRTLDDPELAAKRAKRVARKKNGITLEECFAETSKSEVLSEDNAWYCSRCKELRRATKTLEIWTAPDILVIHLKRFSANRAFRDKIEAFIDCPLEGLDLAGKVGLPEDKGLVYDLFAVDNHYGGLGGGHYTACCRNFFDGKWYDYNGTSFLGFLIRASTDFPDSMVSQRNPDNVVTSAAYLLFYRRRSDRPLGPLYLQKIADQFRNPDSDVEDGESEESDSGNPSRSAAGNGLRLGDSSRNGSSSAFGAAAGALGGGSTSAGSLPLNGAAAGTADDDSEMLDQGPAPPYDEGYAGGDADDGVFAAETAGGFYNGSNNWSFANIPDTHSTTTGDLDDTFDDTASDLPNMAGEDLQSRMLEDFGDDMGDGIQPGMSTPLEEVPAQLQDVDEDDVTNVVLDDEVAPSHGKMD
jgi:ubiquitin carboxyl-terminal hydrolase 4/11/15